MCHSTILHNLHVKQEFAYTRFLIIIVLFHHRELHLLSAVKAIIRVFFKNIVFILFLVFIRCIVCSYVNPWKHNLRSNKLFNRDKIWDAPSLSFIYYRVRRSWFYIIEIIWPNFPLNRDREISDIFSVSDNYFVLYLVKTYFCTIINFSFYTPINFLTWIFQFLISIFYMYMYWTLNEVIYWFSNS